MIPRSYRDKLEIVDVSSAAFGIQQDIFIAEDPPKELTYEVFVRYEIFIFRCRIRVDKNGYAEFDIPIREFGPGAFETINPSFCTDPIFISDVEDLLINEFEWRFPRFR
jgi:hypothetical protein